MSQILSNTSNLQRALELLSNKAAGGGGTEIEDAIITRTISGVYTNDRVTSVSGYAFCNCRSLTTVNFPALTMIGSNAFAVCSKLTSVSFPVATFISVNAFGYCANLASVSFPEVSYIQSYAFSRCSSLTTVSFPKVKTIMSNAFLSCTSLSSISFPAAMLIGSYVFSGCSNLSAIYLMGTSLCSLSNSNAFSGTGITSTTGTIYVPASLLTSYKTATNWAYFSTQFVAFNGGSTGNIITFTIDGIPYEAEEGMTFADWVDSSYNTVYAMINGATIYINGNILMASLSSVIADGYGYMTTPVGGGGAG